jgi:hypothetical protein
VEDIMRGNLGTAKDEREPDEFFDNLKGWMRAHDVARTFGISIQTIYSWKAKGKMRNVPDDLFIKFNRHLYVRTDVLRRWISSQNPGAF